MAKTVEATLLRTSRLRADTTVVPSDVNYPTDSGLLAKAITRICATGRRIQAAGGAVRTRVRDRSRAAGTRARAMGRASGSCRLTRRVAPSAPAVERVIARTGRRPRTVTADRGYSDAAVEKQLLELGVRTVVIPRKGRPGKARQAREHRPAFRRAVKWRTGSEARIATMKRQYGWDRTRLNGLDGARIWTGHGVLARNLVKIATLTA